MNVVRIEKPDWSIFRKHLEINSEIIDGASAREIQNCALFTCLPDDSRHERFDKIDFISISVIPPCIKFRPPSEVRYVDLEHLCSPEKMVAHDVDIASLISIDHAHFLNLHPVRYDKVKEEIALGEIVTPVVGICEEGFPRVDDGRHRIVSLFKFGFKSVRVLVKECELDEILEQLKDHVVRFEPIPPATWPPKQFNISDFIK